MACGTLLDEDAAVNLSSSNVRHTQTKRRLLIYHDTTTKVLALEIASGV